MAISAGSGGGAGGAANDESGANGGSAGGGGITFDRGKCVACGACADKCFSGALAISGIKMSVAEVMEELIQDIDYYRNSGGGITISGGEAACQPEFTVELLREAKAAGIQTAIETNMYAEWPVYEKMLPYLDLVMLDIKLSDDSEHRKWTGTGNARVIENAKKISALKPTIVRTPVIPGVNDNAGEIAKIAKIIAGMSNIERYELLLYNPLGESKYAALNAEYAFHGSRPAGRAQADELRKAAETAGVSVKVS
jgi:pyruvate formate lyase activating enzyme